MGNLASRLSNTGNLFKPIVQTMLLRARYRRSELLAIVGAASILALTTTAEKARSVSDPYDLTGFFLPGVNLAGAGFGQVYRADGTKAKHGEDYVYPISKFSPNYSTQYFLDKGMKSFRLSFLWERLEPKLGGDFDKEELYLLTESVRDLSAQGAWVILDLHNYARYKGVKLGEGDVTIDHFADTWRRLAAEFKSNPRVIFGLMNEPYDISNDVWIEGVNSAIAAVRDQGSRNYILVPGNDYSAAHSWYENARGGSNAIALLRVRDPSDRVVFEAHTYFDGNSSGTHSDCVSPDIGVERLKPFTMWLKDNNKQGFIGEFGAGKSKVCLAALSNLARYIRDNRDLYLGWSYWAAGPKWEPGWMFLIEPENGKEAPQMTALSPYLK